MSFDMKISKKDAVLLGILAFVLLMYVGVWWVLRPAKEQVDANTQVLEEKEMQSMLMMDRITLLPALDTQLAEAQDTLNAAAAEFKPLMTNDELDDLITGMLLSHNLTAKRLTIREGELSEIKPYFASGLALEEQTMQEAAEAAETAAAETAAAGGTAADTEEGLIVTPAAPAGPYLSALQETVGNEGLAQSAMRKELPQSVYTGQIVQCQAVGSRENVQAFVDSFSQEPAIRPVSFEIRSLDSLMQQLGTDMRTGAQADSVNAEVTISLAIYMFDGAQEALAEAENG